MAHSSGHPPSLDAASSLLTLPSTRPDTASTQSLRTRSPSPPVRLLSHTAPETGHRLRSSSDNSRHTTIPRDQSSAEIPPGSESPPQPTCSTSSSAIEKSLLPPSRSGSPDSDVTLVASTYGPSSPSATSPTAVTYSTTPPTCHRSLLSPTSMSNAYPPRSDSFHTPKNAVSAFPGPVDRRPLIDFVTNEWQKNTHTQSSSYRAASFDSEDSYSYYATDKERELYDAPILPEWARRILRIQVPRRVQRYLGGYVLFLFAVWFWWSYWLAPAWAHEKLLDESAVIANGRKGQAFGVNMRPTFADMIHLQELDASLLPSASSPERRLVFVGDVHGCKDELEALLAKVSFNPTTDHLILTGDLIAKGPDSSGTVDLAIKLGASCVRGNWEDRTLLAHNTLSSKQHPLPGPAEDPHTMEDYLDEESFSHGDYRDRALAKLLTKQQVKWLQACPVILKVGGISGFNGGSEIVVAHAGLVPGIGYERQDPFQAMNMRTIDLKTRVPSEERTGEPWEKLWNHHQTHLKDSEKRITVVYGHDAKTGLNIKKYSKGLDSACLKGGSLTAMILDARGRQKIVSVGCKKYKD